MKPARPSSTLRPAASGGCRIEDLLSPAAFPHATRNLDLVSTPLSWVVLTGLYAYKIKKPVHLDYLDASTLERRHALCLEELRLNRRFAPELYVDVVPISLAGGQPVVGGQGKPIEYAVRMQQFGPAQMLAEQLALDTVAPHDMETFAALLAELHRGAPTVEPTVTYGDYPSVRKQLLDNLALLRPHLHGPEALQSHADLTLWTRDLLERRAALITVRKATGFVRECHGDLHARNIVRWQRRWLPFDCLEFAPELRWIDVISDLAFLFMDLIARRREPLAYAFLSRYLEITGDYAGLRLLPLYSVYRALVRAKVDLLGAASADAEAAESLSARAVERLRIAVQLRNSSSPALVIMHGVAACGKSWLSERLIATLGAVRIRSDLERKRLHGAAPLCRRHFDVGAGDYDARATAATYARLLECAAAALDGGYPVIVDATFLAADERQRFHELARERGSRFLIISCVADPATLEARLEARAARGTDPSEATQAVLAEQLRTQQPLSDAERAHTIVVDTRWLTSADEGIAAVHRRLTHRAAG